MRYAVRRDGALWRVTVDGYPLGYFIDWHAAVGFARQRRRRGSIGLAETMGVIGCTSDHVCELLDMGVLEYEGDDVSVESALAVARVVQEVRDKKRATLSQVETFFSDHMNSYPLGQSIDSALRKTPGKSLATGEASWPIDELNKQFAKRRIPQIDLDTIGWRRACGHFGCRQIGEVSGAGYTRCETHMRQIAKTLYPSHAAEYYDTVLSTPLSRELQDVLLALDTGVQPSWGDAKQLEDYGMARLDLSGEVTITGRGEQEVQRIWETRRKGSSVCAS